MREFLIRLFFILLVIFSTLMFRQVRVDINSGIKNEIKEEKNHVIKNYKLFPGKYNLQYYYAIGALNNNNISSALFYIGSALEKEPYNFSFLLLSIRLHLIDSNYDYALELISRAEAIQYNIVDLVLLKAEYNWYTNNCHLNIDLNNSKVSPSGYKGYQLKFINKLCEIDTNYIPLSIIKDYHRSEVAYLIGNIDSISYYNNVLNKYVLLN